MCASFAAIRVKSVAGATLTATAVNPTGNLDRLERAKFDPTLMHMLVEDYRQQVGPAKRGVQRPLYKWSRIETHLIQATMDFHGEEVETWDFFDFKEYYEKRKFPDSQILQTWRAKIAVRPKRRES